MSEKAKGLLHVDILKERMIKSDYDEQDIKEALQSWEVTKSLIPKAYDDVSSSEKCLFCKSEPIGDKAAYASIIIAHKEPLTKKKSLLSMGKKNRTADIGSLVPANVPICRKCRSAFGMHMAIKWFTMIAICALALFVGLGFNFQASSSDMVAVIRILILTLGVVLGYYISKLAGDKYLKEKSKTVHMNIFDVKPFDEMKEKGWFVLQEDEKITNFNFVKKFDDFGKVFK